MSTVPEKEKEALAPNFLLSFSLLIFMLILTHFWFYLLKGGIEYLLGGIPSFWAWVFITISLTLTFLFIMKYVVKLTITALF